MIHCFPSQLNNTCCTFLRGHVPLPLPLLDHLPQAKSNIECFPSHATDRSGNNSQKGPSGADQRSCLSYLWAGTTPRTRWSADWTRVSERESPGGGGRRGEGMIKIKIKNKRPIRATCFHASLQNLLLLFRITHICTSPCADHSRKEAMTKINTCFLFSCPDTHGDGGQKFVRYTPSPPTPSCY